MICRCCRRPWGNPRRHDARRWEEHWFWPHASDGLQRRCLRAPPGRRSSPGQHPGRDPNLKSEISNFKFTIPRPPPPPATPVPPPSPAPPPSPFHQRTRAAIREVLAQREFADLSGDPSAAMRRFLRWIESLLGRLGSAIHSLPEWVGRLIVVWMVLALVAILVYNLYLLVITLRGAGRSSSAGGRRRAHPGQLLGVPELDFDAIYAEARRLLAAGDWLAATKYLYVAAPLARPAGAIAFRLSKTNRDYLGELSAGGLAGAVPPLDALFRADRLWRAVGHDGRHRGNGPHRGRTVA